MTVSLCYRAQVSYMTQANFMLYVRFFVAAMNMHKRQGMLGPKGSSARASITAVVQTQEAQRKKLERQGNFVY